MHISSWNGNDWGMFGKEAGSNQTISSVLGDSASNMR